MSSPLEDVKQLLASADSPSQKALLRQLHEIIVSVETSEETATRMYVTTPCQKPQKTNSLAHLWQCALCKAVISTSISSRPLTTLALANRSCKNWSRLENLRDFGEFGTQKSRRATEYHEGSSPYSRYVWYPLSLVAQGTELITSARTSPQIHGFSWTHSWGRHKPVWSQQEMPKSSDSTSDHNRDTFVSNTFHGSKRLMIKR